jgi:hypothetical protein
MAGLIGADPFQPALFAECFEMAFYSSRGLVQQGRQLPGGQVGLLRQQFQNLLAYTDIYTDIGKSLGRHIDVPVE